ncbi:Protein of unknown function, partial [Gryllus bimaculatus]
MSETETTYGIWDRWGGWLLVVSWQEGWMYYQLFSSKWGECVSRCFVAGGMDVLPVASW